ncbi:MAG TPA: sugar phosphate isomerase/epimerase [Candidatus Methanoperedenaceae archaeon]|nr:sugar phosphate isomerase/epimerase [Candidatus Methanoperedenaceae archaeon]
MIAVRVSCASLFLWEYSVPEILNVLRDAGIGTIEFWVETPDFWIARDKKTGSLRDWLNEFTDSCTLHAPVLDLNPASINRHVREATLQETLYTIGLASELNAKLVTIHAGNRTVHRAPTDEDWGWFFEYLDRATEAAMLRGVHLALENPMPGQRNMCTSPEEMSRVLNRYNSLDMTFDVAHALYVSPERALGFVDTLHDRIVNVHVGGAHDGVPHYPFHMSEDTNMAAVLSALRSSGYDGDLTIEINDLAYPKPLTRDDKVRELRAAREFLQKIYSRG